MRRAGRIAIAVLGLAIAGAVLGAASGALIGGALVLASRPDPAHGFFDVDWRIFPFFGGLLGAEFGAVLAPLASFTVLRRVPLCRIFAEATAGTLAGGAMACLTSRVPSIVESGFPIMTTGGVAGFAVAVALMAWRTRHGPVSRTSVAIDHLNHAPR